MYEDGLNCLQLAMYVANSFVENIINKKNLYRRLALFTTFPFVSMLFIYGYLFLFQVSELLLNVFESLAGKNEHLFTCEWHESTLMSGLHFCRDSMRWDERRTTHKKYTHLLRALYLFSFCLVALRKMLVNRTGVKRHKCLASLLKLLSFTLSFSGVQFAKFHKFKKKTGSILPNLAKNSVTGYAPCDNMVFFAVLAFCRHFAF